MKVRLLRVDPGVPRSTIVLREFPAVIGRGPEAEVRLHDRWASRNHCRLDQVDGVPVVRDLQSRNGTLVNGARVIEAPLLPGDRLTVGLTSFEVQYKPSRKRALAGCDVCR